LPPPNRKPAQWGELFILESFMESKVQKTRGWKGEEAGGVQNTLNNDWGGKEEQGVFRNWGNYQQGEKHRKTDLKLKGKAGKESLKRGYTRDETWKNCHWLGWDLLRGGKGITLQRGAAFMRNVGKPKKECGGGSGTHLSIQAGRRRYLVRGQETAWKIGVRF